MRLKCALANSAWLTSAIPDWRRLRASLASVDKAQSTVLDEIKKVSAGTPAWPGTFPDIKPRDWDDIEPMVQRVARGEHAVVSREAVTHFEPTSGSSSATKLIPSTALFRRQFNRAVHAWIADLFLGRPKLMAGTSYWSISPAVAHAPTAGGIKVGYEDDSEYLGRIGRWLATQSLAVPTSVRTVDPDAYQRTTLLLLLAQHDLRLISVWNPTFLTSLMEYYDEHRDQLVADLESGVEVLGRGLQRKIRGRLWPKLELISCWADGHAATQLPALRRWFPDVDIQAKGLLATEAFVSLPFQGQKILAVNSHYFEFLTDDGRLLRASELKEGDEAVVVVTTGGGLIRYNLGDRIAVSGFLEQTPCLEFLGRDSVVSDLCGEKLNEAFVSGVISKLDIEGFAMLVPENDHYVLYTDNNVQADDIERGLSKNFQYAWAVNVNQLKRVEVRRVRAAASIAYLDTRESQGQSRGDIKPIALDAWQGWHQVFESHVIP